MDEWIVNLTIKSLLLLFGLASGPKLNTKIGLHTHPTPHPPPTHHHKLLGQFQGTYEVEIRGIG
jgi:hypothetical protein